MKELKENILEALSFMQDKQQDIAGKIAFGMAKTIVDTLFNEAAKKQDLTEKPGHIMKVKKDIEYVVSKSDEYCPTCGVKEVYYEIGDGDYYAGPQSFCKNCEPEIFTE